MAKSVEERLASIEARNHRVELDKAWETSWLRRGLIMVLTYTVVVSYLLIRGANDAWTGAIVPVVGFYLSTLAISAVKSWWINQREQ